MLRRPAAVDKLQHGLQNSWELIQTNRMMMILTMMVMIIMLVATIAVSLLFIILVTNQSRQLAKVA